MNITELLAGFTDKQLQDAININRAIVQAKRVSVDRRALAREVLTACHAEAGRRVAKIFNQRSLH